MKITRWGKGVSLDRKAGQMIRVSRQEAIKIIRSLSHQLDTGDPNSEREEFYPFITNTKATEYFSITVVEI